MTRKAILIAIFCALVVAALAGFLVISRNKHAAGEKSSNASQGQRSSSSGTHRLTRQGQDYAEGRVVAKDLALAVQCWLKAAELGDPVAQRLLAEAYFYGKGVPGNGVQGAKWARMAAEQGDARGAYLLGVAHDFGIGVFQDKKEAAKWFLVAAEKGDPDAQLSIGMAYMEGKVVPGDYGECARWILKSAEQGNTMAQVFLSHLYSSGTGLKRDDLEAYKWLFIASNRSRDDTDVQAKKLRELESKLTLLQRQEAQRQADEVIKAMGGAR